MKKKIFLLIIILSWVIQLLIPILMLLGHLGQNSLDWKINQISTYAAKSTNDFFISTSLVLAAIALFIMGVLTNFINSGSKILKILMTFSFGISIAGLVLIIRFEETAQTIHILKSLSWWKVRIQTFHDAGLILFFFNILILHFLFALDFILIFKEKLLKIFSSIIAIIGFCSFFVMKSNIIYQIGLKQRLSFFLIWIGMTIILTMIIKALKREFNNENYL